MSSLFPTYIYRHRRENVKKCSLRGLEGSKEFVFFSYPDCMKTVPLLPDLSRYVVLDLEGEELSEKDSASGLILIDATWRLAAKMTQGMHFLHHLPKRAIPQGFHTAYPRRQLDCKNPDAGLASIEALYIAYTLIKRDCSSLLDNYYWKEQFLERNKSKLLLTRVVIK